MKFEELEVSTQQQIADLLQNQLIALEINVKKYKSIVPVLMVNGEDKDSNIIAAFQPESGNSDYDKALDAAIVKLKELNFISATFSYSTQIATDDGCIRDAVKNYIILKSGLTVVFFTPFKVHGFLKKQVVYDRSIISDIIPNIFENKCN